MSWRRCVWARAAAMRSAAVGLLDGVAAACWAGAGTLAVRQHGGRIVDPRRHLVGSLRETYAKYPHLDREIPAMGYSKRQVQELKQTVESIRCDVVVDGSPADLGKLLRLERPVVQVGYELGRRSTRELERCMAAAGLLES